jgi:predicted AAA+ superfamily ATPase
MVPRQLAVVLAERLTEEPVVVLTGARTAGKSTLLAACAEAHGVTVLDLDDLETRRAVALDPALFVGPDRPTPVCVDEFQHVLPLLDAIKAELNRSLSPGRYLLTGSTRYSTLPAASQSLTGRAHVVTMWPLSQSELSGNGRSVIDTLLADPADLVSADPSMTGRAEYEELVLRGGFPLGLARGSERSRNRWFRDFINLVIERDVLEIRRVRQRQMLPLILRCLAGQSAQMVNVSDVAAKVQLEVGLVRDFIGLLESVFLIHRLEAYGRTLASRVNKTPKVHLVDSGLAAYLLGVSGDKLSRRLPSTLTEFGHLVETYAVNELMKQAGWAERAVEFTHFRTRDQQEVDLVIESDDGMVAAVEVKAASTVTDADFRGLRYLRDKLGSSFAGGVLLNLGQRAYTYEPGLHVVPLDRLWGTPGRSFCPPGLK